MKPIYIYIYYAPHFKYLISPSDCQQCTPGQLVWRSSRAWLPWCLDWWAWPPPRLLTTTSTRYSASTGTPAPARYARASREWPSFVTPTRTGLVERGASWSQGRYIASLIENVSVWILEYVPQMHSCASFSMLTITYFYCILYIYIYVYIISEYLAYEKYKIKSGL